MKDGEIKKTGNSRFMRSLNMPDSYEEFKALLESGIFPFDLNGINPDGWKTIPDWLNKANLLSDATCNAFNEPTTSVPNDILKKLSKAPLRGLRGHEPLASIKSTRNMVIGQEYSLEDNIFILVKKTSSYVGFILKEAFGKYTWDKAKVAAEEFPKNNFSVDMQAKCNESRLFTFSELDGDISYFNSDEKRKANCNYWTSTDYVLDQAKYVKKDGSLYSNSYPNTNYHSCDYACRNYLKINHTTLFLKGNIYYPIQQYSPIVNTLLDMQGNDFTLPSVYEPISDIVLSRDASHVSLVFDGTKYADYSRIIIYANIKDIPNWCYLRINNISSDSAYNSEDNYLAEISRFRQNFKIELSQNIRDGKVVLMGLVTSFGSEESDGTGAGHSLSAVAVNPNVYSSGFAGIRQFDFVNQSNNKYIKAGSNFKIIGVK